MGLQRRPEVLLSASVKCSSWAGWYSCADAGVADPLRQLADRALVIDHAETLEARNAMDGAAEARLDDSRQSSELVDRKPRRMSLRADVLQPFETAFVEPMDPVALRLAIHAVQDCRNDSSRRLWLACLEPAASRLRSKAEQSVWSFTAAATARILLAPIESAKPIEDIK